MSALELVEKIESLNYEDYNMISMLVNRLASKQDSLLQKFSEDEIIEQLTASMEKSNNGETKSARDVSKEMRLKYGV
jgi:hypothetical protein